MSEINLNDDLFDGLRTLPSDLEQLKEHLPNINQILQTKYCLPTELAEFALQPAQSEEFHDLYKKEISRIINHLNKVSHSSKYKAKIDPMRYAAGVILQPLTQEDVNSNQNKDQREEEEEEEQEEWNDKLEEENKKIHKCSSLKTLQNAVHHDNNSLSNVFAIKWEEALKKANMQLELREICEKEKQMAFSDVNKTWLECTPAAQIQSHVGKEDGKIPLCDSTNTTITTTTTSSPDNDDASPCVVDSEFRVRKESELFSTPPEFNGFNVPMATPSSSDGLSPMN